LCFQPFFQPLPVDPGLFGKHSAPRASSNKTEQVASRLRWQHHAADGPYHSVATPARSRIDDWLPRPPAHAASRGCPNPETAMNTEADGSATPPAPLKNNQRKSKGPGKGGKRAGLPQEGHAQGSHHGGQRRVGLAGVS